MNMQIFEAQRNSWNFCNALDNEVYKALNRYENLPVKTVINKIKTDFVNGITPQNQRYELDARL